MEGLECVLYFMDVYKINRKLLDNINFISKIDNMLFII